jgi:hypothetical protein
MLSILYVIKHNAQVKLYFGIMLLTMVFLDIQGCRYTLANVSHKNTTWMKVDKYYTKLSKN